MMTMVGEDDPARAEAERLLVSLRIPKSDVKTVSLPR
jgi:hypothetical protein